MAAHSQTIATASAPTVAIDASSSTGLVGS